MSSHRVLRLATLTVCIMLLLHSEYAIAGQGVGTASGPQFTITVNPSAVVIKVGDKATVNLTVTGDGTTGLVCFGEQGFPSSGFTLTFVPQCAAMQQPMVDAQLVVEATPAAAPQNFTALIQASLSNQTASTPLTITVVPAIPAWIPWLGIALFFLVIGSALFVRPRKPKDKGKKGE